MLPQLHSHNNVQCPFHFFAFFKFSCNLLSAFLLELKVSKQSSFFICTAKFWRSANSCFWLFFKDRMTQILLNSTVWLVALLGDKWRKASHLLRITSQCHTRLNFPLEDFVKLFIEFSHCQVSNLDKNPQFPRCSVQLQL